MNDNFVLVSRQEFAKYTEGHNGRPVAQEFLNDIAAMQYIHPKNKRLFAQAVYTCNNKKYYVAKWYIALSGEQR